MAKRFIYMVEFLLYHLESMKLCPLSNVGNVLMEYHFGNWCLLHLIS